MKPENNKPTRTEKPKESKLSTRKSRMLEAAQKWDPITSQKLREAYSAKTDWARKLIPKSEKETETPEEK
jgi:hypothetical protein